MTPGNLGYSSAMELFPGEYGWNVNVVGNIDQNTNGEIVNDYGGSTDAIEAVFKIVTTKPTTLLIAVRAASASADLDQFYILIHEKALLKLIKKWLNLSEHRWYFFTERYSKYRKNHKSS